MVVFEFELSRPSKAKQQTSHLEAIVPIVSRSLKAAFELRPRRPIQAPKL